MINSVWLFTCKIANVTITLWIITITISRHTSLFILCTSPNVNPLLAIHTSERCRCSSRYVFVHKIVEWRRIRDVRQKKSNCTDFWHPRKKTKNLKQAYVTARPIKVNNTVVFTTQHKLGHVCIDSQQIMRDVYSSKYIYIAIGLSMVV